MVISCGGRFLCGASSLESNENVSQLQCQANQDSKQRASIMSTTLPSELNIDLVRIDSKGGSSKQATRSHSSSAQHSTTNNVNANLNNKSLNQQCLNNNSQSLLTVKDSRKITGNSTLPRSTSRPCARSMSCSQSMLSITISTGKVHDTFLISSSPASSSLRSQLKSVDLERPILGESYRGRMLIHCSQMVSNFRTNCTSEQTTI